MSCSPGSWMNRSTTGESRSSCHSAWSPMPWPPSSRLGERRPRRARSDKAMAPPTRLRRLRPFAVRYINPITRLFAGWLPGFALLTYNGRKTGRSYRTPINVLRHGDHYVFALTYGAEESKWVKNILAVGGSQMRRMARDVRPVQPE